VDEHAPYPLRSTLLEPMDDHAGLRECEGEESAHGVQRNEPVGNPTEQNQQKTGGNCEDNDAVGVDEAASAIAKDVRQVIIQSNGAAETRKIGEGRVGRKGEDEKNRGDRQVVKEAFSKNGKEQQGKNALVARLAGISGGDAVGPNKIGDSRKHDSQESNDDRKRALSVFHGRVTKSANAITYSFDAG